MFFSLCEKKKNILILIGLGLLPPSTKQPHQLLPSMTQAVMHKTHAYHPPRPGTTINSIVINRRRRQPYSYYIIEVVSG